MLEGTVRAAEARKNWGKIGFLPSDCWPRKRLVFTVNSHATTMRVDITQTGDIYWHAGKKGTDWLSLSGIIFAVGAFEEESSVQFLNEWKDFDVDGVQSAAYWGGVTYNKVSGLCLLEGIARYTGPYDHIDIGQLPEDCRPKRRLSFACNRHEYSVGVDVSTHGRIKFISGGMTHDWVSLSGIIFDVAVPHYQGPKGNLGHAGPPGPQGARGVKGIAGEKGWSGDIGVPG
jgi:hypothetical protein